MEADRPSLLRILSNRHNSHGDKKDAGDGNDDDEVPFCLKDLPTPAFVVNRHAFASNCERVLDFCSMGGWKLRPHIKTHKTLEGIQLQACGNSSNSSACISGFVASTIPEIKLLVNYYTTSSSAVHMGSILYGIPISVTKLPPLFALQQRLDDWTSSSSSSSDGKHRAIPIHILLDHPAQIAIVGKALSQSEYSNKSPLSVFVKLDTGYHRAGTTCDTEGILLVNAILQSKALKLVGLYSHCGHAYDQADPSALDDIAQSDMASIQQFVLDLESNWDANIHSQFTARELFENFTISVGSTPSLFHHKKSQEGWKDFLQRHPTVQLEIHPGNYTFFDRQQLYTGACPNEQAIAGRVLSRVIGHYDDENRPQTILLDAGATALTKEATPQGGMAALTGPLSDHVDIYRMSQEVSMARPKQGATASLLTELPLGSMVALLPNHSCLAAACFDTYYVIHDPTGQFAPSTPIVDEWVPVKGW